LASSAAGKAAAAQTGAAAPSAREARAGAAATDPSATAASAQALAALPSLIPESPEAGQRARATPLPGSADALALAQLAAREAARKRLVVIVSADALAAQRLADELPWFAPGLRTA